MSDEKIPAPLNTKNPGHFGPGIIGQEQYERELHYVKTGAPVFGSSVIGPSAPQQPTPAQLKAQPELAKLHGLEPKAGADAAPSRTQLPVTKMVEALEDNPFILNGLIEAEFARQEGPRKAALRILLKAEQAKTEPRADVVARLEGGLTPTASAPA